MVEKINSTRQAIEALKESRAHETKSSMGDKYETGPAMLQQELDKYEANLAMTLKQKRELEGLSLAPSTAVDRGSMVCTNEGIYFLAIGLGRLTFEQQDYFAVSAVSPIGRVLLGKRKGDRVSFQGREITVLEIK